MAGFRLPIVGKGCLLEEHGISVQRAGRLTHLYFGAYHLRLAFMFGLYLRATPESCRRILEVTLWIRRS